MMAPLFVLLLALLVVLASFPSVDQKFCEIVALYRLHQDLGRARANGSRFARDDK
jgi:hypothetical protein